MLTTIKLNYQSFYRAKEIGNEAADTVLTVEFIAPFVILQNTP
jgi:hypothetical protein